MSLPSPSLSIEDLLREVRDATSHVPVADGRVSKELNERTVRYYVSIGVVRPPLRDGNRVVWTRDHLHDLIRVRRAQAQGLSLKLIGSPTRNEPAAITGTNSGTTPRAGWRAANSPALRTPDNVASAIVSNVADGAHGSEWADTGWTVRLAPDILLSGFGPMLDERELATLRGALPHRFAAPSTADTPPRKDDHQ